MKNVTEKITTLRSATAGCTLFAKPETLVRLQNNDLPKKDILPISRAAGVMAAKNTSQFLPYCHPLPIDHVEIDFTVNADSITIKATVVAIWKTGVEMEALTAASIAALNIYDMLKPIDKDITINNLQLLEKTGGKTDFKEKIPAHFQAAVIVTSDGTYQQKREDKSGKLIEKKLRSFGIEDIAYKVLPDEKNEIEKQLQDYCAAGIRLIVTTGGTGLGPRDVTVEATEKVIERTMPAVMNALQSYGQQRTPYAMLSRGLAGVCKNTVIVNLPGSSRGAEEGMNAIFPALLHVYKMMAGGGHEK